jgi:hypothetical protein
MWGISLIIPITVEVAPQDAKYSKKEKKKEQKFKKIKNCRYFKKRIKILTQNH